jgi:formyl-CoA transferase
VMDTKELSDDPTMRARGIFCEIDHPVRGKLTIPGWPVKMSDSYVKVTSSPILGADKVTIYAD